MVTIEKVNSNTFRKVVDMKLPPEQDRFVAPNVVSLAQAWLCYDTARPYAILSDGEVVGFVMLDWDEDERTAGIWRFMIACEHQSKGYGRAAMNEVIRLARESESIDMMYLDYVPGNDLARELYYSLGFRENGDIQDGEIVMTMPVTFEPRVGMCTADEDDTDELIAIVEKEKQAGARVPAAFSDIEAVKAAIESGDVKRFALMGESIGLAIGSEILISSESMDYSEQARERLGSNK